MSLSISKLILTLPPTNLHYKNPEYMCMNIEGGSHGKKKAINNQTAHSM